jgi:hypothetical protein
MDTPANCSTQCCAWGAGRHACSRDLDDKAPSYSVHHRDHEYIIYGPEKEDESWGNATYALFSIMNTPLAGSPYRFYAIDLGGMLKPQRRGKWTEREFWFRPLRQLTSSPESERSRHGQ